MEDMGLKNNQKGVTGNDGAEPDGISKKKNIPKYREKRLCYENRELSWLKFNERDRKSVVRERV